MRHLIRKQYRTLDGDGVQSDGMTIRREVLSSICDAEAIVNKATDEARAIVDAAHARREDVEGDAAALAEQRVWSRAASMLEALEAMDERFRSELDTHMQRVFGAVLERLKVEVSERARLMSIVGVVLQETKVTGEATLMVSKDDWQVAGQDFATLVPCSVEIDPSLVTGECRLCAGQGEACTSFDGSLEILLSTVGEAMSEPSAAFSDDTV